MKQANLQVVGRQKRRYSSYQGEITPEVPNVLKRDFPAKQALALVGCIFSNIVDKLSL
jgi:hypothetical protein